MGAIRYHAMNDSRRFHVSGHVQGVSFRDWTVDRAVRLGLDGWVRNRAGGGVEALAHGPADALAAFETSLHRGPAMARVDTVVAEPAGETPPPGFARQPTA